MWLIKENIIKVLGDDLIKREKIDDTTWIDKNGYLEIPDFLLENHNKPTFEYEVFLRPKAEKIKRVWELSQEMENLRGKPIFFSKKGEMFGVGILTGYSTAKFESVGIQLEFVKSGCILIYNGLCYSYLNVYKEILKHWTEIRELSVEEYEKIKERLLNYAKKPFRVKYEVE